MPAINERLDNLREIIQDKDFIQGNGLSNEVNIRIFGYDPADEMAVRHFVEQIQHDPGLKCHPVEFNLFHIFLDICEELGIKEAMDEREKELCPDDFLKEIHEFASARDYIEKMHYEWQDGDVVLFTGIGEVYPYMRVHVILNAIQKDSSFSMAPVLVMYPGDFNGTQLKLFNRLEPSPYYRAFNEL